MISDCSIIHEDMVNNIKTLLPVDDTFIKTSSFFKVLGDKTRIKILWILNEGELCVCDIAILCNMTKSAISHQLSFLKQNNIVKSRKDGKEVFYSLTDNHVKFMLENSINHIIEKEID